MRIKLKHHEILVRKDRFSGGGAVKEALESKRTDEIEKIRRKVGLHLSEVQTAALARSF